MRNNLRATSYVLTWLVAVGQSLAIGWPVAPRDSVHPLGNNWGEYQNYGGSGYYHNGIDVFPRSQGDPCYAVAHGWVKAYGTIQAEYHYRLAISDSPPGVRTRCPGWLYAHIDPDRPHKAVGDEVQEGEQIGYLVPWPVAGFDHCHFARISDTGMTWNRFPNPTWWFTTNPLLIIEPVLDTIAPTIQDARTGQRFALCRNNTNTYFNDLNAVLGDVDIVVRAYDETGVPTTNPTWDRLQPYKYVWSVRGSVASMPPTLGIIFSGLLPSSSITSLTGVAFKQSSPCQSLGDYDRRDYYVIVTNNSDGDSTIEISDTAGCWHSWQFPDDDYWIKVEVSDVLGNTTVDSMRVRTINGNVITETQARVSAHTLDIPTVTRAGTGLGLKVSLLRPVPVRLEVFDASGRRGETWYDGVLGPGRHELHFVVHSPGIQLVVLSTDGDRVVHRLIVVP